MRWSFSSENSTLTAPQLEFETGEQFKEHEKSRLCRYAFANSVLFEASFFIREAAVEELQATVPLVKGECEREQWPVEYSVQIVSARDNGEVFEVEEVKLITRTDARSSSPTSVEHPSWRFSTPRPTRTQQKDISGLRFFRVVSGG